MGIRQLKTFIESDPNIKQRVCVEVNLKHLAEEWGKNGGSRVIVADGHNIARLFRQKYDFVSGGEYKSMVKKFEDFVQAFKGIGVELVVFFGGNNREDGPLAKRYLTERTAGRTEFRLEMEKLFSTLYRRRIIQHNFRSSPMFLTRVIKDAAELLSIYVHVQGKRDRHMVDYVVEKKCLGILSDDTDLFVFENVPHIFSIGAVELNEMTTIEFRRTALLEILNLRAKEMPIFSTLMGNDMVLYHDTKTYHEYKFKGEDDLSLSRRVTVLATVTRVIYRRCRSNIGSATSLLANEIFGFRSDLPNPAHIREFIFSSLDMYRSISEPEPVLELPYRPNWEQLVAFFVKNRTKFHFGKKSVRVLRHSLYFHKHCFESCEVYFQNPRMSGAGVFAREFHCMCNSEVLSTHRKRMYGVLLYEKIRPHNSTHWVEEHFISGCRPYGEDHNPTTYIVLSSPTDVQHPGLYRLHCGGHEWDDSRWKLFLWILSTTNCNLVNKQETSVFRQPFYKDHFGLVGFALLYLHQVLRIINGKELEVLLVMAASVPVMNADDLDLRTVQFLTRRSASVSTIYLLACRAVRWTVKVCNVEIKCRVCDLYSGLLFHYLFQENDPSALFNDLPPAARENYNALKTALVKCCCR